MLPSYGSITPSETDSFGKITPEMHLIVCYSGLAGCFGGMSVLLAKSTAELVKDVISGSETNAFEHFQPFVIVVAMALTLFAQISILNAGERSE